jgi:hypothetical protein
MYTTWNRHVRRLTGNRARRLFGAFFTGLDGLENVMPSVLDQAEFELPP